MTRTPIFDSYQHEIPRGIVTPPPKDLWRLRRWAPNTALSPYIKWVWMVEWDLDEYGPFETTTLPYLAANLVVDNGASILHGPTTRLFSRRLTDMRNSVPPRWLLCI